MAIDDPIQPAVVAEHRIDLDRIEYRLKGGVDVLDVYYSMVPVDAEGRPTGGAERKCLRVKLDAATKAEMFAGVEVGNALAAIRKLAVRRIKGEEATQ